MRNRDKVALPKFRFASVTSFALVAIALVIAAPPARAVDSDGDGVDNTLDCRPTDGTTWFVSSQARNLSVTGGGGTSFSWLPPTPAPASPAATVYDVLRSNGPHSFASAICLLSNTTATSAPSLDATIPSNVYFYLVRAKTACGGVLGTNSSGVPIAGTSCSVGNGSGCSASAACTSGYCCSSVCRDTTTDVNNCGACGSTCTNANGTTVCSTSVCTPVCNSGFRSCDGNPNNGCETSTNTDVANCGNCGLICPSAANATPACTSGSCGLICNSGFRNCDGLGSNGCETSTNTDVANCGNCGNICPNANATPTCSAGACGLNCNTGFLNCDGIGANGCETNTTNNVNACGNCSTACPGQGQTTADASCTASSCTFTCKGENYDVDNNASNGCEQLDNPTGNHTAGLATNLGSANCNDATIVNAGGILLSDSRGLHVNPAVSGFDPASGSAPDFHAVTATGGICTNDFSFSLTTSGGGAAVCYQLQVQTNSTTQSCVATGAGGCVVSSGSGAYATGSTVSIKVSKTCSSATRERMTYTVSGHL